MNASGAGDTPVADLEEQRRFLLGSLRDLEREHEAGEIGEADYDRLRDDYTARAAAVLEELEERDAKSTGTAASKDGRVRAPSGRARPSDAGRQRGRAPAKSARRPGKKRGRISPGVFVVIILATVIVGAGIGVLAFSTDEPTESGPSPTERQLAQASQLVNEDKAVEALKIYDEILEREPDNQAALSNRGWLLVQADMVDEGLASIERALSLGEEYPYAHFFRAMVLYRYRNDPAGAVPEFEAFLATNPPAAEVVTVQRLLDQARQAAAG